MATKRMPEGDLMWQAEQAYRESLPLIVAMAKKAGMDEVERDEIVQRVAVVLVEKAAEYDPDKGSRRMWAAGIARHILQDARRAAREERRRIEPTRRMKEIPTDALTPEQTLRARESLTILTMSVREEHRAVFDLDAQEHTSAEIGQLLHMPPSTAEWRLREARKDVDRALRRMGEDRKSATRVRGLPVPLLLFGEAGTVRALARKLARWVMRAIRLVGATPHLAAAAIAGLVLGAAIALTATSPTGISSSAAPAASLPAALQASGAEGPPSEIGQSRPSDVAQSLPSEVLSTSDAASAASPPWRPRFAHSEPPLRKVGRHKWMLPTAILAVAFSRGKGSAPSVHDGAPGRASAPLCPIPLAPACGGTPHPTQGLTCKHGTWGVGAPEGSGLPPACGGPAIDFTPRMGAVRKEENEPPQGE